jgi:hypothetical protein
MKSNGAILACFFIQNPSHIVIGTPGGVAISGVSRHIATVFWRIGTINALLAASK